MKKSKPEAGLNSYKISVKAEDLQKALDPSIWPMRVKVREYIYYSRRVPRPGQSGDQHGQGQRGQQQGQQQGQQGRDQPLGAAGGQDERQQTGAVSKHQHQQGGADRSNWDGVPTHGRFDAFNTELFQEQP